MRKILLIIALTVLAGSAYAATDEVRVPFTVQVDSVLELKVEIRRMPGGVTEPYGNGSFAAMGADFGYLRYNKMYGYWAPDVSYCFVFNTNSSGQRYQLKQEACNMFFAGSNKDITHKMTITPAYSAADKWTWTGGEAPQGEMGAFDYLGDSQGSMYTNGQGYYESKPAVLTGPNMLFTSMSGYARKIRCYVGFYTADPAIKARWGLPTGMASDDDGLFRDNFFSGITWNNGRASANGSVTFTLVLLR